jgi:hypothetical protein
VAGPDLKFTQQGDQVLVNEAVVETSDVKCTNGVVHIIDSVLVPPDFTLPAADAGSDETETPPPPAEAAEQPGDAGAAETTPPAPTP